MMIMNKNTNIHLPQQITIPEDVNALLGFMNDQMAINARTGTNLELIRYVLYEPEIRRRHGKVCMSAFM